MVCVLCDTHSLINVMHSKEIMQNRSCLHTSLKRQKLRTQEEQDDLPVPGKTNSKYMLNKQKVTSSSRRVQKNVLDAIYQNCEGGCEKPGNPRQEVEWMPLF